MDERDSWVPPRPPAPFSVPPGTRSVVIPDEPPKRRRLIALIVVGCVATAALTGGVLLLMHGSNSTSANVDSSVATIASSSTTTTMVLRIPGGVEFLLTRSPVAGSALYVDTSALSVGTCFNVKESGDEGVAEPQDCDTEHYYQLYAVGSIPADITEFSRVDEYWLHFCADKFSRFVGSNYMDSRFDYSGSAPADWEFPESRALSCFLYVTGEFGWIGSADGSGQ